MSWGGGVESLLSPCTRLDKRLNPRMDPGGGSILEYEYSVTQSLPGNYGYVKWLKGWTISRAEPRQKDESGNTWVAPKVSTPVFPTYTVFLVSSTFPSSNFWQSDRLPSKGDEKYRLCLDQPMLWLS